jgi:hypothetical protein
MPKHPFRVAVESGASQEELSKLFSPEVVFYAPMLTKPVTGVSQVLSLVAQAVKIAGPIHYSAEVSDPQQSILIWEGQVDGHQLEAATILVDGDDGLVSEVRVLMRAWPVFTLFRNAMYDALSATIPEDYWELGPKPADTGESRKFTPIAMQPIDHAPGMVLHSPILAKPVSGNEDVQQSVALAHEVQSASSYTSIIATPELLIELFDCDADGYPMEGMWIQKLDDNGQIYELTVMLRPYPAVTVLRNRAKALAEERGFLGNEYWELPDPA